MPVPGHKQKLHDPSQNAEVCLFGASRARSFEDSVKQVLPFATAFADLPVLWGLPPS